MFINGNERCHTTDALAHETINHGIIFFKYPLYNDFCSHIVKTSFGNEFVQRSCILVFATLLHSRTTHILMSEAWEIVASERIESHAERIDTRW